MENCDNESVLDMDTASLSEFNIEKTTDKREDKRQPYTVILTSTPLKKRNSPGPSSASPPAELQRCTTPKLQKIRKPKVLTPKHLANAATFIEREQEPARSIEGWTIFVRYIHEEANEDEVVDTFSEHGKIKNIHLNLDRRTGFVKGYAIIEYATYQEAVNTIENFNGKIFLGLELQVDWCFIK